MLANPEAIQCRSPDQGFLIKKKDFDAANEFKMNSKAKSLSLLEDLEANETDVSPEPTRKKHHPSILSS